MNPLVTIKDIVAASERLKGVATCTPLQRNKNLSDEFQANIYLKREDLQIVRSYKIRGAYNFMASRTPEELKNGIVCASAGNHAQGVAFSCRMMKTHGAIFMPATTPKQKISQVKMFGKEF
ncbi:MAG: pyridoxal-phosphate dependent enzyme, partial [Cytophagaceae bacterium]|nr:pyridoxal-phosphate dependent enzyme [Cytophagaceae bacterium]